jgi:hypothetical protein
VRGKFEFVQLLSSLYIPFFREMLNVKPLGLMEWVEVFGIGFAMLAIVEAVKYVSTRNGVH